MLPNLRTLAASLDRRDAFTRLQAAEQATCTSNWCPTPEPTPAQAAAGNYRKGRVTLHGLRIRIENPAHTIREGRDPDGTPWRNQMRAAYGYIEGTRGADGDELDVFVGPWPESQRVWVLHQTDAAGRFDEHKVLLGFPDRQQAVDAYRLSYSAGWKRWGAVVPATLAQLKAWIKSGDTAKPMPAAGNDQPMESPMLATADRPVVAFDQVSGLSRVFWTADAMPASGLSLADVLYRIRSDDGPAGLVMDAVTMADLTEGAELLQLDALVTMAGRLQPKMAAVMRIMEMAGGDVKPLGMQISDPLRRYGGVHVAVLYELSDGQTITVWFHNPDSTPAKLTPADDLVSWRWQLNKKDVTIVVAPETGKDLNVREVARRLMRLAEKNSAAFQRANARRAETMKEIAGLREAVEDRKATLQGLMNDIDAIKLMPETPPALGVTGEVPADGTSTTPGAPEAWASKDLEPFTAASYATIRAGGNAALEYWQDALDHFFGERMIATRNALRALGWDGPQFGELTKTLPGGMAGAGQRATLVADIESVGAGKNTAGVTYSVTLADVEGAAGAQTLLSVADDLSREPDEIAQALNGALPAQAAPSVAAEDEDGDGPVKWPSLRSGDMVKATRLSGETTIGRLQLIEQEKDSPYAVQAPGWRAIVQPSDGGKPQEFFTYSGDEIALLEETGNATPIYQFPDATDEARALFAVGAMNPNGGAYKTAVDIDKLAASLGLRVSWAATATLPAAAAADVEGFDSAAAEAVMVNRFRPGDKVVLPNNGDGEVQRQEGAYVFVRGKSTPLHANHLKLANGDKPDRKRLDAADHAAMDACEARPEDEDEDDFDAEAEFDACPDMDDDEALDSAIEHARRYLPADTILDAAGDVGAAITTLGIALDIVRNNEPISRAEGNTEQADLQAEHGRQFEEAIRILQGRQAGQT